MRHKFIPGTEKRGTWCARGLQTGGYSEVYSPDVYPQEEGRKQGTFFLRLAMRSSAVKGNKSHLKRSEQV